MDDFIPSLKPAIELAKDLIDVRAELSRLKAEYEDFKKLFRGKKEYCETCVALRSRNEKLEAALREIVYEQNGRWFCGVIGDADVTDEVGELLDGNGDGR